MLLAAIVRDHDGAVVKTIGDAVMASFTDPAHAVRAALAMQAGIASSWLPAATLYSRWASMPAPAWSLP